MIAGPIVRYNEIATQITNRRDTIDDKLVGFIRFCIGLAKKVLIANVMAEQADIIFERDNYSDLSFAEAWLGLLAYTFQIYFDFSGYSDMAIGLGRMMGFRYPENFDSPYTARSITEFWRRWHITLGQFMRDYLYIPLGGNRVSTTRLYFNLWIVFLLSGLWHGASWNFVLWGAFHGLFLILDRLFLSKFLKRIGKIPSTIITFIVIMMGWVLFRIEETDKMGLFFKELFSFDKLTTTEIIPAFAFIASIAFIFSFITKFHWGKKLESFFYKKDSYGLHQSVDLIVLSLVIFILSLSAITGSSFNPFIYFRF